MALLWESPSGRFTLWDDSPYVGEQADWTCEPVFEFRDDPDCLGAMGHKTRPREHDIIWPFDDPPEELLIYALHRTLMKLPDDESREAWLAAMLAVDKGGLQQALLEEADACECGC